LFGAPVAHEDDPERAVRAALAIREAILAEGAELQLRIAVTTGEALVSVGARVAEGEGMASGDVVNTAARLQAAAAVNRIHVHELMGTVRESNELTYWRQGRSLPYGAGAAFWALSEMVKAQAGISEADSPEEAERKLQEAVAEAIAVEADAAWIAGHLRPLL